MKVIIAGSRSLPNTTENINAAISALVAMGATELLSGCATGADAVGEMAAEKLGIPVRRFPADWDKWGKRAGPIRNAAMAKAADACVLFPGGKGADNMRKVATEQGLRVVDICQYA